MIDFLLSQSFEVHPAQWRLVITTAFALLLFLGVMAILLDKSVEIVAAALLLLAIWLLIQIVGPNLYAMVAVLLLALLARVVASSLAVVLDSDGGWNIALIIDEFLNDAGNEENRE